MNLRLPRPLSRWTLAAWLLALPAAYAAVDVALARIAARHLAADAEQVAVAWADYAGRIVPDLDLILEGEVPSPLAQDHLGNLRRAPGVAGFTLHDSAGQALLDSDSLTTRPEPAPDSGAIRETVRAVARDGAPQVALRQGDGRQRPLQYSAAFVPLKLQGGIVGVVDVRVDQTQRAAAIGQAFRRVGFVVGAALLAVFGIGLALWYRHGHQKRAAEERVRYLAAHDVLTGALNRASFEEALRHAVQQRADGGPGFAVLCVDLDRFKDVNDSLGHPAGDEMLRQVGRRLQALVRATDVVARLGGDEFAVMQVGVDNSEAVGRLAQRINESLSQPYDLLGQRTNGGASVGASIQGVDGNDPATLMHCADLALYRAKTNGRRGYSFYDPGLDEELQDRRALTRDLREALATQSLVLHYQPVWHDDGRELAGYEALARWPHATRGFVSPARFIALAEETGLIDELGQWVLRSACAEAASWPQALKVAVNLSPAQFRREGHIVQEVADALAATGLAPGRLEVEITESLLLTNTDAVLGSLNALHALGVRIAMDDFGTGYSSLAYLWKFPFDKLKIDRAFTQAVADDEKVNLIVRSIVSLAHSMKISVNVEGVETLAQQSALKGHGADELQGYLLGKPMPSDRLPHKLNAQAPAGVPAG